MVEVLPDGGWLGGELDASFARLLARIASSRGVDLSGHKPDLLLSQVVTRMAARAIDRLDEYVEFVDENGAELSALVTELLVGSTRFFRDPAAFRALRETVLPRLLCERRERFRAWVVGCSTGEELYSLAITICEALDARGEEERPIQIFATDLRPDALTHARRALYGRDRMHPLSPGQRERFFEEVDGGGFRVRGTLRQRVLFARHDLLRDPPFAHIDLVSCRNLLMYLGRAGQRRALERLHFSLTREGVLLLGSSESVLAAEDLFAPLDSAHKIYLKRTLGAQSWASARKA